MSYLYLTGTSTDHFLTIRTISEAYKTMIPPGKGVDTNPIEFARGIVEKFREHGSALMWFCTKADAATIIGACALNGVTVELDPSPERVAALADPPADGSSVAIILMAIASGNPLKAAAGASALGRLTGDESFKAAAKALLAAF